jgi:apolipoprotein N-acyltransferase
VSSGRTVLQAGPTGYTAIVTHDGRVRRRSVLEKQQVITGAVTIRTGRTLYARLGDWPWILASIAAILTAWSRDRRKRLASSAT